MSDKDEDVKKAVDKILNEEASVHTTSDGWVFSFSETVLEELLKQAKNSKTSKAIVFVKRSDKLH